MRIRLALFDPAFNSSESLYWTWRSPDLHLSLLNRFYYEVCIKNIPPHPNALKPGDIVGGAAALPEGWVASYRFFDGGRDQQNRPDRYVLLTAWIRSVDAAGLDCIALLESDIFRTIENVARTCPVPPPRDLAPECPIEAMANMNEGGAFVRLSEKTGVLEDNHADIALRSFAALPPTGAMNIHYTRMNGRKRAMVEMNPTATEPDEQTTPLFAPLIASKSSFSQPCEEKAQTFLQNQLVTHTGIILTVVLAIGMILGVVFSIGVSTLTRFIRATSTIEKPISVQNQIDPDRRPQ